MSNVSPLPVAVAQNSDFSQRLLAAQSRLYSDAKILHGGRILSVAFLAGTTVVLALALPNARPIIGALGGAVAFLWSVLGSDREKRRRQAATNIQEQFDTHVFGMPSNSLAFEPPSPTIIAEAAARYKGNRTKDWYPDTRPVERPLDVLICQRSNLGWGAASHRFYSSLLVTTLVFVVGAGVTIALAFQLSAVDALTAILVPLLGPARELIEAARANRESAESKAKAESKVNNLWQQGMQSSGAVHMEDCRRVQDLILQIRQTNAHVPDWVDGWRRERNEGLMQESAKHLIEEAIQHGRIS